MPLLLLGDLDQPKRVNKDGVLMSRSLSFLYCLCLLQLRFNSG